MTSDEFVLDQAENPHPRMLAGALEAQAASVRWGSDEVCAAYWAGYLKAMCDATGCTAEEITAWMDRHRG